MSEQRWVIANETGDKWVSANGKWTTNRELAYVFEGGYNENHAIACRYLGTLEPWR